MRTLLTILLLAFCLTGPAAAQYGAATPYVVPRSGAEMKMSFAPVVKDAAPAVVNVYTKGVVRTSGSIFDNDPFFRDFFGRRGYGTMPRERVQSSLGSGVIVRPEGIIVTNNHVIDGMSEIKIVLSDRREFEAEVLLADEKTDLAVLRIDAGERLPFLDFADSDNAAVGDIVLAIGNPFGVGQTVTNGIVSALARTQVGISDFQSFIQTDAAINPGNSGGALVDVDGRLLGVNTAIFSRSGGSNGIGFAIPANLVRQVVSAAVDGGGVIRRPWIGASMDSVESNMAVALGLDRPGGVILNEIFPGGPADSAGLKPGDVITAIETHDVFEQEALKFRIATKGEGDRVSVTYLREGRPHTARLALEVPPETPARNETLLQGNHPLAGAVIANMSPAVNSELGRAFMEKGVVITKAEGGRFGIRSNMRIISINSEEVSSVDDVQRALATPSRGWLLRLQDPRGRISTMRMNY